MRHAAALAVRETGRVPGLARNRRVSAALIGFRTRARVLRLDPIRADIAHRIEIRFAQLRRQCPHVEGGSARLALLPARSPLDLEIGVRPRSQPNLVLVAGGDTTEGL